MTKLKYAFLALCVSVILLSGAHVLAEEPALRGYIKGSGYVYVTLGTYPTERSGARKPVVWRVLSADNGEILLLSEYILDVHQVIECDNKNDSEVTRNFRRISDYGESDLHIWMNGEMLDDLCSEQDFKPLIIDKQYGKLYCLTADQILNPAYGFSATRWSSQPSHTTKGTAYAKSHRLYKDWGSTLCGEDGNDAYWIAELRDPEHPDENIKMSIVGGNGHLSHGVYTRVNIGVRPATVINAERVKVISGSGTKKAPYVLDIIPE